MSGREPNNCQDRRHDDLAAYALGALPEPEAEELVGGTRRADREAGARGAARRDPRGPIAGRSGGGVGGGGRMLAHLRGHAIDIAML